MIRTSRTSWCCLPASPQWRTIVDSCCFVPEKTKWVELRWIAAKHETLKCKVKLRKLFQKSFKKWLKSAENGWHWQITLTLTWLLVSRDWAICEPSFLQPILHVTACWVCSYCDWFKEMKPSWGVFIPPNQSENWRIIQRWHCAREIWLS